MAGLLWVTNVPAPYRIPVWRELGKQTPFTVGLLAENEHNRRWSPDALGDVSHKVFRTAKFRRGEATLYALTGIDWIRSVKAADAVILPGWENPAAWQMLIVCKLLRKRAVGFYESTMWSWSKRNGLAASARSWFFRHVDKVITVGNASTDAVTTMGVTSAAVIHTTNPIDVENFAKAAAIARAGATSASGGHRFIYVGQLIRRKNVGALIESFAALAKQEDQLTICGEGPLATELQAQTTATCPNGSVLFKGYVEPGELPSMLSSHHTLVLPSTIEVYGLVVSEALACGLQVVVSNRCGVAADVRTLSSVYVSEPTAAALTTALQQSRASWSNSAQYLDLSDRAPAQFATKVTEHLGISAAQVATKGYR